MNAFSDALFPDLFMELERGGNGPLMFERVKSARAEPFPLGADYLLSGEILNCFVNRRVVDSALHHPGDIRYTPERRDHGGHLCPCLAFCPNKSGPAGAEYPFMCSCREKVGSHLGDRLVLNADAVHTIYYQKR